MPPWVTSASLPSKLPEWQYRASNVNFYNESFKHGLYNYHKEKRKARANDERSIENIEVLVEVSFLQFQAIILT